jgi:hypothetical protein
MFAIAIFAAGLVIALSWTAQRSNIEDVTANNKPGDDDTEPSNELELSMQRDRALRLDHERDNTAAHKDEQEFDSPLTAEDILNFERLFHPELHRRLREQEAEKKPFKEILREMTAHIKPSAPDLDRDRDREDYDRSL